MIKEYHCKCPNCGGSMKILPIGVKYDKKHTQKQRLMSFLGDRRNLLLACDECVHSTRLGYINEMSKQLPYLKEASYASFI
jgi:hypothetical protein